MTITLLQGDCREKLRDLADRSVQCIVTSPPYFGLRRYDVQGEQIGLEPSPAEYVAALVAVFRECRRVLRDDGVLWVNLGDSYGGERGNKTPAPHTKWQRNGADTPGDAKAGTERKNLLGIPWKVAFALQDDGWVLRSDIIWSKPNPMPESVTDRPTRAHEYVFMFAKQARYYYDATAIAEQAQLTTLERNAYARPRNEHKHYANGIKHSNDGMPSHFGDVSGGTTRNRRSVWTIATRPYSGAHFAVFPEQLIAPCILAGSASQACERCGAPWERQTGKGEPVGRRDVGGTDGFVDYGMTSGRAGSRDVYTLGFRPTCTCPDATGSARSVVLDPFVGSGTTCRVAEQYDRDSIGIDLGYTEIQEQRTDGIQKVMVDLL